MPCIAIPQALSVKLRSAVADRTIRKGEADKKAVLIREMLRQQFRDDLYSDWINIHSRKLIRILGRATYAKQLNRLIDWGVILRTDSFYAGNAPDRFRDKEPFPKAIVLLDGYRNHANCEFWPISSKHSANAVRDSFTLKPRTENARQLAEYLPEFNLRIADDELRLKQFRSAWTLENIHAIQSKRFFMTEDSFSGRIHTNYSQLQSEARSKLFVDNRSVVSLDVSSMQPLLLGWMARESMTPICYNNIEEWIRDCESGGLYEKLRSLIPTHRKRFAYAVWNTGRTIQIDITKMTAKRFKRQMLQVLFDRNEQAKGNPIWEAIQNHYPTIASYIWQLKRHGYKNAARMSQQMEVQILIHQVAAEHARQGLPIITIHDEIVSPDEPTTRSIMQRAFNDIGLTPLIK